MRECKRQWRIHPLAWAAIVAITPCTQAARAQSNPAQSEATMPAVEIVGTTPVPGTGVPKDQIPANVQTANRAARRRMALSVPRAGSRRHDSCSSGARDARRTTEGHASNELRDEERHNRRHVPRRVTR